MLVCTGKRNMGSKVQAGGAEESGGQDDSAVEGARRALLQGCDGVTPLLCLTLKKVGSGMSLKVGTTWLR